MSGRSQRETRQKLEAMAKSAYRRVGDAVRGRKAEEVPLGDGAVERARSTLRNRGEQLDALIAREGG